MWFAACGGVHIQLHAGLKSTTLFSSSTLDTAPQTYQRWLRCTRDCLGHRLFCCCRRVNQRCCEGLCGLWGLCGAQQARQSPPQHVCC